MRAAVLGRPVSHSLSPLLHRAAYAALRARGKTHGRALRSIADRLLALACAMLRDHTVFDVSRRTAA